MPGPIATRDIIVVGASAGGVEALQILVGGLPASLPATVFITLHIPPHSHSFLSSILERAGPLPVEPAHDGAPIVPGRIYVAVPDHHLLVEKGRIRVTRGPKENRARPAVDALFRSAAYHFENRVIGVVLTGNLDDGTAGLWAIKDRGGLALVQSPEEAVFPSMPQSALQHVAVDHVLPVAELPSIITRLCQKAVPSAKVAQTDALMAVEITAALGENASRSGSLQLGPVASNTCPACHGALARIQDGGIVRYRCHVGHAFSTQSLFAEVNEEIDSSLGVVLRAIDERIFLLRQMEQHARNEQDQRMADQHAQRIKSTEYWAEQVRHIAGCDELFK